MEICMNEQEEAYYARVHAEYLNYLNRIIEHKRNLSYFGHPIDDIKSKTFEEWLEEKEDG